MGATALILLLVVSILVPFALGDFPTLQSSNWIDDWWNQWNSIGHLQETSTEYTVQYEVDFGE